MILFHFLRDFFIFVPVAFLGWVRVLLRFFSYLFSLWTNTPVLLKISLVVFFFQLVFSTRPWFEYKIRFNELDETLSVSSKVNLIFIFLCLVNFVLLLYEFYFSRWMILSLQAIMAVLFLFGYQSPTSLHVDFINPSDYNFNSNFYIFACLHLVSFLLATYNLLKKKPNEIKSTENS